MKGEQLNQSSDSVPAQAVGPNPKPTGSRFETSTENYAADGPPTPTVTESAKRAHARLSEPLWMVIGDIVQPEDGPY